MRKKNNAKRWRACVAFYFFSLGTFFYSQFATRSENLKKNTNGTIETKKKQQKKQQKKTASGLRQRAHSWEYLFVFQYSDKDTLIWYCQPWSDRRSSLIRLSFVLFVWFYDLLPLGTVSFSFFFLNFILFYFCKIRFRRTICGAQRFARFLVWFLFFFVGTFFFVHFEGVDFIH